MKRKPSEKRKAPKKSRAPEKPTALVLPPLCGVKHRRGGVWGDSAKHDRILALELVLNADLDDLDSVREMAPVLVVRHHGRDSDDADWSSFQADLQAIRSWACRERVDRDQRKRLTAIEIERNHAHAEGPIYHALDRDEDGLTSYRPGSISPLYPCSLRSISIDLYTTVEELLRQDFAPEKCRFESCGKWFVPKRRTQEYCRRQCSKDHYLWG